MLLDLPRWRIFWWSRNQKLLIIIHWDIPHPFHSQASLATGLDYYCCLLMQSCTSLQLSMFQMTLRLHWLLTLSQFVALNLVLKAFIGTRVYRKWSVDVFETLSYLNILLYTLFTWYWQSALVSVKMRKQLPILQSSSCSMYSLSSSIMCTHIPQSSPRWTWKAYVQVEGVFHSS